MLDWAKKLFKSEVVTPTPDAPESLDMPASSVQLQSLARFSDFSDPQSVREELLQPEKRLALIEPEPPDFHMVLDELLNQERFRFNWDSDRDASFREAFYSELRSKPFVTSNDGSKDWEDLTSGDQFDSLLTDIEKRAAFFKEVSGAEEISIRVAVLNPGVNGDNLPFHIDSAAHLEGTEYLHVKSLSIYGGFGCEWVDDTNLKPGVHGMLQGVASMSPDALLIDTEQIYTSPVFANLLLKLGEEGLVHRTPKVSGKRIRVQIDVIP